MEEVAEAINYQMKNFDGSGYPPSSLVGEDIPLVSRILRVAGDFEGLISNSIPEMKAIRIMQEREGIYDPVILDTLEAIVIKLEQERMPILMAIYELTPGMILADDVLDGNGLVLITKYQEVTDVLISRLKNYSRMGMVQEPIKVISPKKMS